MKILFALVLLTLSAAYGEDVCVNAAAQTVTVKVPLPTINGETDAATAQRALRQAAILISNAMKVNTKTDKQIEDEIAALKACRPVITK